MNGESPDIAATIERMFTCVGIERVICVDDAFSSSVLSVNEVLISASSEDRAQVLGLDQNSPTVKDDSLLRSYLQEAENAEDNTVWAEIEGRAKRLIESEGSERSGDAAALSILASVIVKPQLEEFSLQQWEEEKEAVMEASRSQGILVLFDRDFSAEGGDPRTGERLLSDFQRGTKANDAWCGLLTHTVTPTNEHDERRRILEDEGLDPSRFILISKQYLGEDTDEFAGQLRTTLLAPALAELMETVSDAMTSAHEKAKSTAHALAPHELEDVVVRSSAREGVWEPDTLIRLFELLRREEARNGVRGNHRVRNLVETVRCLGDISSVLTQQVQNADPSEHHEVPGASEGQEDNSAPPVVSSVWQLQRHEIYEAGEHINTLLLPIELGDVFERVGNGRKYVLVSQPCDLMVRGEGKREPEWSHLILLEIREGESAEKRFDRFELPYFDVEDGSTGYVKLKHAHLVRKHILDLCAVNQDGHAVLNCDDEVPDGLIPSWRQRYGRLSSSARKTIERDAVLGDILIQAKQKQLRGEYLKLLEGHLEDDLFKATIEANPPRLTYDCHRIGRLCEPYASALLTRFSDHLARDAYLHDLTSV